MAEQCEHPRWQWLNCDECADDQVPCDIKACVTCDAIVWPDEDGYDEIILEVK